MKRVERRGTLDGQAAAQAMAHHAANPHMHVTQPARRQDTLLVDDRTTRGQPTLLFSGTRLSYSYEGSASRPGSGHGISAQTPVERPSSSAAAGHRRPPTPPYITSISTREQYASGSQGTSGDEDGDGEGDGDGEMDVDAELARTLPSSEARGARRAPQGSPGSKSPSERLTNGSASGSLTSSISSPGPPMTMHERVNGAGDAGAAGKKRSPLRDMDIEVEADGEGEGDAEAELDAEIMGTVDPAQRVKEEDS